MQVYKFMSILLSNTAKNFLNSLVVAVVLLLVVFWGINTGKVLAQAEIIGQTSQNVAKSLQFYYQDQNRYPSVLEFSQEDVMLNYLTNFPLPNFASASCSQSFVYKRLSDTEFNLSFCLPAGISGYKSGWNIIDGVPETGSATGN